MGPGLAGRRPMVENDGPVATKRLEDVFRIGAGGFGIHVDWAPLLEGHNDPALVLDPVTGARFGLLGVARLNPAAHVRAGHVVAFCDCLGRHRLELDEDHALGLINEHRVSTEHATSAIWAT